MTLFVIEAVDLSCDERHVKAEYGYFKYFKSAFNRAQYLTEIAGYPYHQTSFRYDVRPIHPQG